MTSKDLEALKIILDAAKLRVDRLAPLKDTHSMGEAYSVALSDWMNAERAYHEATLSMIREGRSK